MCIRVIRILSLDSISCIDRYILRLILTRIKFCWLRSLSDIVIVKKVVKLCEEALKIYPDCVDAQTMLAEIQTELVIDFIDAMEKAVASSHTLGRASTLI